MVVIVAIAGLALGFIVILLISLTAPREEDASAWLDFAPQR